MKKSLFLTIGIIVMCFNSLYQYSWNALSPLLAKGLNASIDQIAFAFTLFTIFSTISQVIGGYIADIKGPKLIGIFSSILSSLGFLGIYLSKNLISFYLFWSLGSSGEGILYMIASNLAVKWYQEKRGFATGLVSFGFGLGATIANPFIISSKSFREPSLIIGLSELIVLPILLYFSEYPTKGISGLKPSIVITTRKWWLIYFSYIFSVVPLLSMSSALSFISREENIELLAVLISAFAFMSGVGRPIIGLISDKLGRYMTLMISIILVIIGSILLSINQIFISAIIIGLFDGALIPLYFSLIGDVFGAKYSTSNNGILYTGKAIAGLLGGIVFSLILIKGIFISGIYLFSSTLIGLVLLLLLKIK
ncbi:MFS transporter [Caldisphaera lagunensis]|uniref:MFS transporter n=1 Tax=Caldisphaera lagunensis TaxID=200415 RepID=UPI000662C2EC|nr:MFS transporter [Caldisphaera lagunensis]